MLRFAPSPNGPLHLGHALSAIANETMARATGLPLTLRFEDIDRGRSRPEFEDAILDDLAFLGIAWTPPVRRQSTRFARYRAVLEGLTDRALVYPSFATRREIADHASRIGLPRDPDGAPRFVGDAAVIGEREAGRRRDEGAPAAWRLDMARAIALVGTPGWEEVDAAGERTVPVNADPMAWGDVVLARKEIPTSYHLSVVTDDADEGITHVVRGADLFAATAVHRVLQTLIALPAPLYRHHGLVPGEDGRKLSKSNGARSLAALRQAGMGAAEIRAAALAGEVSPSRRSPATS